MLDKKVLLDVIQESGVAFGTSGARGLVSAMTDEVCAAYTQAFIETVKKGFTFDKVAIAIDLRPSSPVIALACANMLQQLGLEVVFCGAIPTPALALFAQDNNIPGIMVTGSHIPFDRNGMKFYRPDGEITKADETSMLSSTVVALQASNEMLPSINPEAKNAYINRYKELLGDGAFNGLRLAIYQHSSVGRDLMQQLLTELGAEVVTIGRSDTFVPIDTEAVSAEDAQRGLDWASQYEVDSIISTDGDGDRPLISDEQGRWLRGDIVGLLTAKALNISELAIPVSCNTAVEASGLFKQVLRTRIGSPYVIAGMETLQKQGSVSVAGFEANGGFLLGTAPEEHPSLSALPTRDAVLPIVCLLAEIKKSGKPLSELVEQLPKHFTASDRLQNFATEKSKALIERWLPNPNQMLKALNLEESFVSADNTDGLRVTCSSGNIIHLRPSGNAPELRCYVESSSTEKAKELVGQSLSALANYEK